MDNLLCRMTINDHTTGAELLSFPLTVESADLNKVSSLSLSTLTSPHSSRSLAILELARVCVKWRDGLFIIAHLLFIRQQRYYNSN